MHRIWMGMNPQLVLSGASAFVVGTVLVLHIFAFGQFNWPGTLKAKYSTPPAATR